MPSVPGLSFLPAGQKCAQDQTDLTLSVEKLEALKQDYALLIFDMPPLALPKIAPVLASWLDGMVLVIEAEKTPHATLQQEKALLEKANPSLFGTIFNKQRQHLPSWLERMI